MLAVIIGERELAEGIVGLRHLRGAVDEGDGAQSRVERANLLAALHDALSRQAPTDLSV